MEFKVVDSKTHKSVLSEHYNYIFNKGNGLFQRWGKTDVDDPQYSPIGPEILDIEITTKCSGIRGSLCSYCYKSNTPVGKNMSLETFKEVIDKVNCNNQLTQIAFGLGSTGEENPDLVKMCEWIRNERGIIPNGTVADISEGTADRIAKWFGACAISYHGDKDVCFDSVKKLTDRGMNQCNIHFVLSEKSFEDAVCVLHDMKYDERLSKMNALVFLSLKKKGRAEKSDDTSISKKHYKHLIDFALDNSINIGFDSCGCHKFLDYVSESGMAEEKKSDLLSLCEACESSVFSAYVDTEGKYYPCSFCEGDNEEWKEGMNVIGSDFMKDVWFGERTKQFRKSLLAGCRKCPIYEV